MKNIQKKLMNWVRKNQILIHKCKFLVKLDSSMEIIVIKKEWAEITEKAILPCLQSASLNFFWLNKNSTKAFAQSQIYLYQQLWRLPLSSIFALIMFLISLLEERPCYSVLLLIVHFFTFRYKGVFIFSWNVFRILWILRYLLRFQDAMLLLISFSLSQL